MKTSHSPAVSALRLIFKGITVATKPLPHARQRRSSLNTVKNVRYGLGEHREQVLDVIRAKDAEGVQPALMYIHGGGFAVCSKETHEIITSTYAAMGFTVFSIEYRLAPEHPFPAAFHDSCDALLWILKHAAEFSADVNRLVIAGESAGGNLALAVSVAASFRDANDPKAAAVFDAAPTIRAIAPACGLLHVSGIGRLWRDKPENVVGRTIWRGLEKTYLPSVLDYRTPAIWADPLVLVETKRMERPLPPTYILCGTADLLHGDSERLDAALDKLGVDHEFHSQQGGVHAYHALVWTEAAKLTWSNQRRFLAKYVEGIDAEPT